MHTKKALQHAEDIREPSLSPGAPTAFRKVDFLQGRPVSDCLSSNLSRCKLHQHTATDLVLRTITADFPPPRATKALLAAGNFFTSPFLHMSPKAKAAWCSKEQPELHGRFYLRIKHV